ncbi:MAB_1171c family putative transporter [Streptomyces sp. RFCAC02]|uniref:MAB_1171c family putative transporter n=1 Tax=Streptomyces sp. RFCAC02 TaxID=2499143 RepID=UPI00101F6F5D|nr:MAB_1171c family putative transporter [Streptomyces sp. RFCAC02]
MTVAECAEHVGRWSVLLMWAALIVRARPALARPRQRALWLAILTAASATTLFQPEVIDWAVDITGDARTITLARNIVGILAAGLTLLFVVDCARPRRARMLIASVTTAAVLVLIGMDLAHGGYAGPSIPSHGGPVEPSAAYWLVVCGVHLVADLVIAVLCHRYAVRSGDRDLAWSLKLFAIGSVLAVAYWVGYLVHLFVRIPDALPWLALLINLHGVSRALTLLVPLATGATERVRQARGIWLLWPLWRDLVTAVPAVALVPPQRTRMRQFLRFRTSFALQEHRQIIEVYDAALDLQAHLAPGAYDRALERAGELGVPAADTAAAALAGALAQARRAKLAGEPASSPHPLPGLDSGDTALLLALSRHWPTMARSLPDPEPIGTLV